MGSERRLRPESIPEPGEAQGAAGEVCPDMSAAMILSCGACGQSYAIPVGCGRLRCASCAPDIASKRAERKFNLFGGDGVPLGCWVFTLPRQIGQAVGVNGARELRRRVAAFIELYYRVRWGVITGSVIAVHPESDSRLGEWRPHFHVIVPLLGLEVSAGLKAAPSYLAAGEMERVKTAWAMELGRAIVELKISEDVRVNLHYKYLQGGEVSDTAPTKKRARALEKARIAKLHRLRYDLRPFPEWSAGELGKTRLLSPSSYGLLSGRADKTVGEARLADLAQWREVTQGPELEQPVSRCTAQVDGGACGCELEPLGVAVGCRWRIEERYPGVIWRVGTLGDEEDRSRRRGDTGPCSSA